MNREQHISVADRVSVGLHPARPADPRWGLSVEPLTLPDGYITAITSQMPPSPTGAPVLILHGIQSHPGWFVGSGDAAAAAGHAVYQFQRRGSGASRSARGHAANPRQLLDDLDAAVAFVLNRTGTDRLHLVGVSWGGKYAACYALDAGRAARLTGITLAAPGVAPRVDVPFSTKLAIGLCVIAARRKTFAIPLSEPELFTDNPAMQRYIDTDPHRLHRATAAFLLASRRMDRMLTTARNGALALPVSLILAAEDRIIDNTKTHALLDRLAEKELAAIELPGAHTLEFQADPEPFRQALVACVSR